MPSVIVGQPFASGPQQIVSGGNQWSGSLLPIGGVQLRLAPTASGNVYVGLSGNVTLNSGGMFLSGGGLLDGMLIAPGDGYFIPKARLVNLSGPSSGGGYNIFAWHDAAASGQARLYYEAF